MKGILITVGIFLLIYASYRVYRINTQEDGLDKRLANGAIILDVRTAKEFNTGHIDQSINISLGEIRERYVELDTSKTYITVCSHGIRSVKVQKILKGKGFKKVYNGGAWTDLQRYIEKNQNNIK